MSGYHHSIGGESYRFADLKTLMARATRMPRNP